MNSVAAVGRDQRDADGEAAGPRYLCGALILAELGGSRSSRSKYTCNRPPRKVTYFDPVAPRLARNTVIESTFEVGRHFRCTMCIDCSELDPGAVIRPVPGEWHPHMRARLDEE